MKTQAFVIRVVICFLLSLVPLTELENRLYDVRLRIHGPVQAPIPMILVQLDAGLVGRPIALESLKHDWLVAGAKAILDPRELGRSTPRTWLPDPDGIVRASAAFDGPDASLPARKAIELGLASREKLQHEGHHFIRFASKAGQLKRCTPVQIRNAQCASPQGAVLVLELMSTSRPDLGGPNTFVDGPRLRTPFGEMSEAELLAHDFATLVGSHGVVRAGWPFRIAISLLMIVFSALVIRSYSILVSALTVSGVGVAVVLVGFQLIFSLFDLYVPGANPALSMLIAYLVFTGYRTALQENLQWRALKQAQYLRELDQMKTNFLSLVSHDLKTPLAKIQGATERLRRERTEGTDRKELLESIENSTEELRNFINSLLNLSRIESQKVILNKKSNDLNVLIKQVLKRLEPLAAQKNVAVRAELEPLFSIECDEDLMRQVITNIVDNAIKYSPTGSQVLVRTREGDGQVTIEVEDAGPGIPKDQLPLMFRKFSRYVRPIQDAVKGTGLGLYLSKYFIELHGGSIRLRSLEGKGSTFSVTLPLQGEGAGALLG